MPNNHLARSRNLGNHLLNSLPLDSMLQGLQPVTIRAGQVLNEQGGRIGHVYFPCSGMISLVATFEDGDSTEVGCVGKEGMIGVEALLGSIHAHRRVVGQIDGAAYRVPLARVKTLFLRNQAARDYLLRYVSRLYCEATQTAACNLSHSLEERLARWLLLTLDRTEQSPLSLTHDVIAQMLGARRSSVTLSLGMLQRSGVIRNRRARVEIVDRAGLENMACECYSTLK